MTFGGVDLMRWIDGVQTIERDVGQNMTNSLIKIGREHGEHFQYTSPAHGTITVTALILNKPDRRALASALTVDKPQQLVFGDEPDKYYMAIPDAQATLTEAYWNNVLTIVFIVPDALAHSVAMQTADNMPYKNLPENLLIGTSSSEQSYTGDFSTVPGWINASSNASPASQVAVNAGSTYTYSIYLTKLTGSFRFGYWGYDSNRTYITWVPSGANSSFGKVSWTFTVPSGISYIVPHVAHISDDFACTAKQEKLELGSHASPWSPNPADPEYYTDTITVKNDGTYPVYPVIEATMRGDNGVLTLINENNGAILQFGNPGEVDGVQAPNSETVFHYNLMSAPSGVAVNTGTINYPTYPYGSNPGPNTIAGSWDYLLNKDAATPVLTRTAAMHWAGPTYHGPIKANAAGVNTGNLIWSNRFNVTTSVGALGRAEFNLQSGDDIAICFVIRDSTYAADALTVEGWVNGQNIFSQDLNRKLFTNGMYEIVESKLGNTTTFKLTKIKQLSASGIISSAQTVFPPVTIDGVADTPIDSFTVWMAGFSNKTGWTINWSDSVFQWVNVDYWKDLPNRFKDGDTLLIEPSQIKVFVNDVEDRTLHAIGNDWEKFRLDPGETKIKIIASDFAATPTVVATYRGAFL